MATLRDISRHLGISVTQVSRALNGHADVSKSTRQRIVKAARDLGYSANISARKLKSGRSGIVAMVMPPRSEQAETDILIEIVIGLSAEFSRRRMQFVLHVMSEGEDTIETYERLSRSGTLDGFVLVDPQQDDPRIHLLSKQAVPFVVHGRERRSPDYAFVDIDNRQIAQQLTTHLLEHGHRRIAFVDGPAAAPFVEERVRGLSEAFRRADQSEPPRLTHVRSRTVAEGHAIVQKLLADAHPPTAIVAGNVLLAQGIYRALDECGVAVPRDISLVAHDDAIGRHPAPPDLTRTRSALSSAWAPLADCLVGAIEQRPPSETQVVLSADFVDGATVATRPDFALSANQKLS